MPERTASVVDSHLLSEEHRVAQRAPEHYGFCQAEHRDSLLHIAHNGRGAPCIDPALFARPGKKPIIWVRTNSLPRRTPTR